MPPNPEPYLHSQDQGNAPEDQQAEDKEDGEGEGESKGKSSDSSENSEDEDDDEARDDDSDGDLEEESPDHPFYKDDYTNDPGWNELTEEMEARRSSDDEDDAARSGGGGGAAVGRDGDKDEKGQENQETAKERVRRKYIRKKAWAEEDTPAGTVAVLVFACWTLRVPVIYQDFVR